MHLDTFGKVWKIRFKFQFFASYVILNGDLERRISNVRLRLKLPSDRAQNWAKHVSDDLQKSIFRKKNGRILKIDQKFLVFCNFHLIWEELDGFGRQNQLP